MYGDTGGEQYKANVSRFAAYKAAMATKLARTGFEDKTTGKLIPQDKIAKATLGQFNDWLATEVNTATARARTAKQFDMFNDPQRRRLFGNIKWIDSRSADPRPEHEKFYGHVWAKDDPFWASNQPGNLWNCKCDIEETDEPVTDNANIPQSLIPKGL
ncbi:MAG: hypothetical protein LBT04_06490, partial [Prevotellaceae bacterium]|nr:hypothetical protein [Prevotellaceae bacterium]